MLTLLPFLGYIAAFIPIIIACVIFTLLFSDVLKVLPLLVEAAFSMLNPVAFVNDLIFGVMMGIELLVKGIADIFLGKAQEAGEKIPGFKNGLFPNGILGSSNKTRDQENTVTCLKPTTIRLVLMVLCPPFAVFMKYGLLRGWLWIILCWILTYYFYYFPGLLFSALHTMCF